MIRLYFYVEGWTEQLYAQTVLRNHLAPFGVNVEGAVRASTGKRHGVVHRGGGRHYAPAKNDLVRLLKQQRGPDVRITTMFDLYALYADFPGAENSAKFAHLPRQRAQSLQQAMADDIPDPRLIPYIQLHEFETILFCDLSAFEIVFDSCRKQLDALAEDVGNLIETPELIDDGQHSAPSKRIARQFPDYPDLKPDAPVAIATMIDLAVVRVKCPHFNDWLTKLEELGGAH